MSHLLPFMPFRLGPTYNTFSIVARCPRTRMFGIGIATSCWNHKSYTTKRIRPTFVADRDEIVVVTVYVYYFS